jgi:hypothetical protein
MSGDAARTSAHATTGGVGDDHPRYQGLDTRPKFPSRGSTRSNGQMATPDEEARQRIEVAYHYYQRSYLTRTEMRAISKATWDKPTLVCRVIRVDYAAWTGTTNPKYHRLPLELFGISPIHRDRDAAFLEENPMSPITAAQEPTRENEREIQARIIKKLDAIEPGLTLIEDRVLEKKRSGRKHRELDILCRDQRGGFVVVELKRRDVKARHIIGQIIEYMGRVKMTMAQGQESAATLSSARFGTRSDSRNRFCRAWPLRPWRR